MALSLFGEALPHEDDTAASLIRRTGYPPEGTYRQLPDKYHCPCCEQFGECDMHPTIVEEEAAARKRKLMQFDVIEERAKGIPKHEDNRHRPFLDNDGLIDDVSAPAPPSTVGLLNEGLKNEWANQHPGAKLIVTVHHGKKISAEQRNQLSVILRCGAFEGQTVRVPRGPAALTKWDELFEFPYPNDTALLEFIVINHALKTKEKTLGGAIVPCDKLHDAKRGIEETVPVMAPSEAGKAVVGTEGPLGTIIVSWFVSLDGSGREVLSAEKQHLSEPLACNFVAHRLFQYTDNGSKVYPGGVLCVLRDPEEQCSESVLYHPLPEKEPSLSKFYDRTGYHYLPENNSQIMQMQTGRKVGHILICIPNQKTGTRRGRSTGDAEEELLVVGAVPLDFELLHHRGSAVLLIESKSKDDALWGEISIEWANKSLLEEKKDLPVISKKEALVVTVVRGLNLVRADDQPVVTASVEVATRDMAGSTVYAPNVADGDSEYVVTWNQEIRFIGVRSNEKHLEVKVFENGFPVAAGKCKLSNDDKGVVIVPVYDLVNEKKKLGELVLSYARIHKDQDATKMGGPLTNDKLIDGYGNGLGDEEDEEVEEKKPKAKKSDDKKKSTEGRKKRVDGKKEKSTDRHTPGDNTDVVDGSDLSDHHSRSRDSSHHSNKDGDSDHHSRSRDSSHHSNKDGDSDHPSRSGSDESGTRSNGSRKGKKLISASDDTNDSEKENTDDASRKDKKTKESPEHQKMLKNLQKEITEQEKEKRKKIQKDERDERKELKSEMKDAKRQIKDFDDDTDDDESHTSGTSKSRSKTRSSKTSRTRPSESESGRRTSSIDRGESDDDRLSVISDDDNSDSTSRTRDSDTSSNSSNSSNESTDSDSSSSSDDSSARRRQRRKKARDQRKLDEEKKRKKASKTPGKSLKKKSSDRSPEQSPPAYDRSKMTRKPAVPRAADALHRPNYWQKKEEGFKDPFFPPGSAGAKELHADYDHSSIGQAQEEAIRRIHDELNRHTSLLSSAQRARSSVRRSRSPSESPKREKFSEGP